MRNAKEDIEEKRKKSTHKHTENKNIFYYDKFV